MGYFVRVFCKSETIPAFSILNKFLSAINSGYKLDGTVDDSNNNWTDFEFHYKESKMPILVELNWTDEEGSVGKDELEEFLETIGSPGLSLRKRKVIKHLKHTKYIICSQLATSDIDNDGYIANSELLKLFVDNYQGMLQADGEGFYDKNKIIVKDL
jgi:hypothetical protein